MGRTLVWLCSIILLAALPVFSSRAIDAASGSGGAPENPTGAGGLGDPSGEAHPLQNILGAEAAPAPAAAGAGDPFTERSRITLNVQFDTNRSDIKEAYYNELDAFARVMNNHPDLKVTIEGHTDNVGKADHNLKLSRERAESVMNYLVSQGIDPSRITALGCGQTKPVADNRTAEGKGKNRRVEAEMEYEKAVFLRKKPMCPPAAPHPPQ